MSAEETEKRPVLSRQVCLRGPRFYPERGKAMFVNHIDASTREGPREATDEDRAAHPKAWAAYRKSEPGRQKTAAAS